MRDLRVVLGLLAALMVSCGCPLPCIGASCCTPQAAACSKDSDCCEGPCSRGVCGCADFLEMCALPDAGRPEMECCETSKLLGGGLSCAPSTLGPFFGSGLNVCCSSSGQPCINQTDCCTGTCEYRDAGEGGTCE